MNQKNRWTSAEYDRMSWHDCRIHSIALDQEGQWQSDLVIDMDYILEWQGGSGDVLRFRIAPAVLRFMDVDKLSLDVSLEYQQSMDIYSIERAPIGDKGFDCFHWLISLTVFPEQQKNRIEFDATGFVQELTGDVVETGSQHLAKAQRLKLREAWRARGR